MLRWLCKILPKPKRNFFWCKLLAVSVIGHLCLLFALLFAYKGSYFSFDVTVNRSALRTGTPVVFLPFRKTVGAQSVVKKVASAKAKTKPKLANKKTTIKKISRQKPEKIVQQKKKPAPKKNTKVAQKKPVVKKENKPKKVAQKAKPKKEVKKAVAKKEIKSKSEKVIQEAVGGQPIYVGQVEMAALQMQDEMQIQVSKVWCPPAGLPKDLQCAVKIVIDWNGKPREVIVEQPSGVLMYDISARTAVAQLDGLPRWAHGKEFTITFKQ